MTTATLMTVTAVPLYATWKLATCARGGPARNRCAIGLLEMRNVATVMCLGLRQACLGFAMMGTLLPATAAQSSAMWNAGMIAKGAGPPARTSARHRVGTVCGLPATRSATTGIRQTEMGAPPCALWNRGSCAAQLRVKNLRARRSVGTEY